MSGKKSHVDVYLPRRRPWLRYLWRLVVAVFWLTLIAGVATFISFIFFPPFGLEPTARVLLVGLDGGSWSGGSRRSDTIILYAARVNGSGATLLSVPRDARVSLAGARGMNKINAAYAYGNISLLRETLAQRRVLGAELPHYLVFDSDTVRSVVDALGGVEINVAREMHYDDNAGHLHIHLQPGKQRLNGDQVVGYLRWRKNQRGGGEDDFSRTERQRAFLMALEMRARSWQGMVRLPMAYRAFRRHSQSNLSVRQLAVLVWASRQTTTAVVPGTPMMLGGISYVQCDWRQGQELWQQATQ